MPLIKARPNRVRTVRHISHLQEPNRDALALYARFIGDTADYVLNQLIDTTIAKDREFLTWRAAQTAEPPVPAPPKAPGRDQTGIARVPAEAVRQRRRHAVPGR